VMTTIYTEFLCASALHDERAGRVEAAASQEVAELEPVDETVTTIPEVEQVEHLANVCTHPHTHGHNVTNAVTTIYFRGRDGIEAARPEGLMPRWGSWGGAASEFRGAYYHGNKLSTDKKR